jgi:hypothetical protein
MPTVIELRQVCKELGVIGFSKMRKSEMLRKCRVIRRRRMTNKKLKRSKTIHRKLKPTKTSIKHLQIPKINLNSIETYKPKQIPIKQLTLIKKPSGKQIVVKQQHTPGNQKGKQIPGLKLPTVIENYETSNDLWNIGMAYQLGPLFLQDKYKGICIGNITFSFKDGILKSLPLDFIVTECNSHNLHLIPFSIIDNSLGVVHANSIIIDINKNTLERFEPHGIFMGNEELDNKINTALKKYCQYYKLEFIPTLDFCPILNVQAKDIIKKEGLFEPGGYCLAWSLWYIDLRLKYPDINRKELIDNAMNTLTSVGFRNYIRKYSSYIIASRQKIINFPDKYLIPVKKLSENNIYFIKINNNYEMWKYMGNNKISVMTI